MKGTEKLNTKELIMHIQVNIIKISLTLIEV